MIATPSQIAQRVVERMRCSLMAITSVEFFERYRHGQNQFE
jgi:hypothetical protein